MADPTIQIFCCRHSNKSSDMSLVLIQEFNTDMYNTVCMLSSIIGILGSIYQVIFINKFNQTFFFLLDNQLINIIN